MESEHKGHKMLYEYEIIRSGHSSQDPKAEKIQDINQAKLIIDAYECTYDTESGSKQWNFLWKKSVTVSVRQNLW